MKMKRIGAAASALLLMLCTLTGCGSGSQAENITEEQMPYGSTVTEDSSREFTMSYDKRFLEDALVDKIAGYYRAIQERDGEAFNALMFPLYHQYQMKTVYNNSVTDQQIIDTTYDAIREYFGFEGDFEYSLIDITDLVNMQGVSDNRDLMTMMLEQIAEEAGEPSVTENTQALYEMTVTRYVEEKGKNTKSFTDYAMQDETLYAIKYQDQWYLMYS